MERKSQTGYLVALHSQATCPCRACQALPTLDLKFILHHRDFVLQQVAGISDLLGTASLNPRAGKDLQFLPSRHWTTCSAAGRITSDAAKCMSTWGR